MADVFISYSRKDKAFVQQMHNGLDERDRDTWVDWEGIEPSVEWLNEIYSAIESSQVFVFIISPDSVISETCTKEIDHALEHNKRIIPIVHREVDTQAVHAELAKLHWIFFRDTDGFDEAITTLIETIDKDFDWIRAHTRLLVRAREWDSKNQESSFLLRGQDLQDGEQWLSRSAEQEPKPTALQTQYLIMSRRAATKRQSMTLGVVVIGLIITVALAVYAFIQQKKAVKQANIAMSRELAVNAKSQLPVDPDLSLLLAMEALKIEKTAQATDTLRQIMIESELRLVLKGHRYNVSRQTVSPDETLIVKRDVKGAVVLWNFVEGKSAAQLTGCPNDITNFAFSPNGQFVVTTHEDGLAHLWEVISGKRLIVLRGHAKTLTSAAFSHDSDLVAAISSDGMAIVWKAGSGEILVKVRGQTGKEPPSVRFSPKGKFVITAHPYMRQLWDLKTGEPLTKLPGFFSPNGRWQFVETCRACEAEVHTRHPRRVVKGFSGAFGSSAVFSSNGKLLVRAGICGGPAACESSARIYDARTGKEKAELIGHSDRVNLAVFSSDNQYIATASLDGTARVWLTRTGEPITALIGHGDDVTSIAFSASDRYVVTASRDGTARVWDAGTGKSRLVLKAHKRRAESAVFSTDGTYLLTTGGDNTVRLWDAMTGRLVKPFSGSHANLSPDGNLLVTYGADQLTRIWQTQTDKFPVDLKGHPKEIHSARFSPDNRHIVTASADNTAHIWEAGTGRNFAVLKGHTGEVFGAAYHPDGQYIVTASQDKTAIIWEAITGKMVKTLKGHQGAVTSAVFSPNGQYIVTESLHFKGGDRTARIWETAKGKEMAVIQGSSGSSSVTVPAFSPEGELMITTEQCNIVIDCNRDAHVRDLTTGQTVVTLRGHENLIYGAAFSPNGNFIVTADGLGVVRMWEAATGRAVADLTGHRQFTVSVAFSPNGDSIATTDHEGKVLIHSCEACGPIDALIARAQKRMGRDFTNHERQKYLYEVNADR